LEDYQIGFVPGMGSEVHLLRLLHLVNYKRTNLKLSSFIVLFDIKKAFDSIDH